MSNLPAVRGNLPAFLVNDQGPHIVPTEGTDITLKRVQMLYRNFAGNKDQFNPDGERSFCILLTEEMAQDFIERGWNVKRRGGTPDGDPYIKLKVSFRVKQPRATLISMYKNEPVRQTLREIDMYLFDVLDIAYVDVTINPYAWSGRLGSGISLYMKNMYAVMNYDVLDETYSSLREIPLGGETAPELPPAGGQTPGTGNFIEAEDMGVEIVFDE